MKVSALQSFRRRLAADQSVYGLWVTLEAAAVSDMAAGLGFDWVVIDAEHGHLDWREILEHVRATIRSETVALVRVGDASPDLIKRALDIGADGVVIPRVESAGELEKAVRAARHAPAGTRGISDDRATCWGHCFAQHVAEANANVLVVPIIETVRGARNIRELLGVEGTEVFFFDPADHSADAGFPGQLEAPAVTAEIDRAVAQVRTQGKHAGVVGMTQEALEQYRRRHFRMLGVGFDAGIVLSGIRGVLAAIGRPTAVQASFVAGNSAAASRERPVPRPPESLRPDRMEVIHAGGARAPIELAPGVVFDCLAGADDQARNLTTGIVKLAPGAKLPYHSHTYAEGVTVLGGRLTLDIETRRYALGPLDNALVPPELPHAASNPSARDPAVLHIAMATSRPARTLVERFFSRRVMPDTSTGLPGAERVTRFQAAPQYQPAGAVWFVDYFNNGLVPGAAISGGYGRFRPGGRLPAYVNEFDESVCIIAGTATCVVEGRRHRLTGPGNILVPCGRAHYFINESPGEMAMVWAYAGPQAQRLLVDDACATEAGSPWRLPPIRQEVRA